MNRDTLLKQLMVTFLGEMEEHVRAFNGNLLALEKGEDGAERAERIKALFRTVHSLKGAARSVNLEPIVEACHLLEEIFAAVRESGMTLRPEQFALLFGTADALEEAGMRLREQGDLVDSPLAELLPRLEAAASDVSAPAASAPSASLPASPLAPRPRPVATEAASEQEGGKVAAVPQPRAPVPAVHPQAAPKRRVERPLESLVGAAFVRVPADKLDALLTLSGELLMARRQVTPRAEDVAELGEFVGQWRTEWRAAMRPFGALLTRTRGATDTGTAAAAGSGKPLPRRAVEALRRTGDRLGRLEQDLDRLTAVLDQDSRRLDHLDQVARQLDAEVRRVRMLPFAEACQGLERGVRDLAQAGGKKVALVVEGGSVELDRSVLEGLKDPLNHLVRNAVDHGIEAPERRRAAGKRLAGRVTVAAELRGSQVEVVVADDGGGLDLDALRAVARKRGLADLSDGRELMHLIFLPGLSTSPIITDVSGRGVGLDVVKQQVEQLHGTIELWSEPGRGTRFTLAVPLTLTTIRALLVNAGGQAFAFPTTNVRKLILVDSDDVRRAGGREVLVNEGDGPPLLVATLAEALGLAAPEPAGAAASGRRPALVVAAGERRMVFVVDELLTEQEVVVKGLGARVRRVRNVSGGTILSTGQVALVLNVAQLVRTALSRAPGASLGPQAPVVVAAAKRLLVVDDSITTRTLEKSLLEAAGYQVATAVDGAGAWRLLQEHGADLVVSDVDMPGMDGLELTEAIRSSSRFTDLPVVLLTARASAHDKARGVAVGADAYLVKDEFDQKALLETIAQLL